MKHARAGMLIAVAALTVLVYLGSFAEAGQITDNLKLVVDRVLILLKDPAYAAPEKKAERTRLIHDTASGTFDWEEMARRTLGPHWRDITPEQKKQFIDIFVDFLERTYISKIDLFLQESKGFTSKNISYFNETIEQERYALVETKILLNDKELPLNYKLINKSGRWVVYDLTIEGVGLVANYRTQFNEILANGSFQTLIDKLKVKEGLDIFEKKSGQQTASGQGAAAK
ncbi:MAG: ABC transporter substrate-binding protein [Deltaproteobacteria bacterium]|nr:ABC transporter substrate-binding protein [Deltaproteobacteria bacterium]